MRISRVFVYGTLLSGMRYHELVKPFIKRIEPASVQGVLYDLPYGYPAMVAGEGQVLGELIELKNLAEALTVLDDLEGFRGEHNPGNLYNRVVQTVQREVGDPVEAYVYHWVDMEELKALGTLVPDGDWRKFKEKNNL